MSANSRHCTPSWTWGAASWSTPRCTSHGADVGGLAWSVARAARHRLTAVGGALLCVTDMVDRPDPSKVCVHVGLGVWPELTLDEALKFLDRKAAALTQCAGDASACR